MVAMVGRACWNRRRVNEEGFDASACRELMELGKM